MAPYFMVPTVTARMWCHRISGVIESFANVTTLFGYDTSLTTPLYPLLLGSPVWRVTFIGGQTFVIRFALYKKNLGLFSFWERCVVIMSNVFINFDFFLSLRILAEDMRVHIFCHKCVRL